MNSSQRRASPPPPAPDHNETSSAPLLNFWNVPNRNTNFVGRGEIFEKIEFSFNRNEPHAVITACYGLGGNGKTSTALEYAWRFGHKFSKVFWFDAENPHRLHANYVELGIEEKIIRPEECTTDSSYELAATKVKRWFESPNNKFCRSQIHPKGWLLVYDNSSTYNDLIHILPVQGGKILVTSRYTEWPQAVIPLSAFTPSEYTEYVGRILGGIVPTTRAELEKLGQSFAYHPLAVVQAISYIRMCRILISDYLELYAKRKGQTELLRKPLPQNVTPVFLTWDLTMDVIRREMPLAANWLEILASFNGEDIPHEFLHSFIRLRNKDELYSDVLGTLNKFSMIQVNAHKGNCVVHRLVQEVIALKTEPYINRLKISVVAFTILNSCYYRVYVTDYKSMIRKNRMIPHVEAVLDFIHKDDSAVEDVPSFILPADLYQIELCSDGGRKCKKFELDMDFLRNRLLLMQDFNKLTAGQQRYDTSCKSVRFLKTYLGDQQHLIANCCSEVHLSALSESEALESIPYMDKACDIYHTILQDEEKFDEIHTFIGGLWDLGANLILNDLKQHKGLELIEKGFKMFERVISSPHFNREELSIADMFAEKAYKDILAARFTAEYENQVLERYFENCTLASKLKPKFYEGKTIYQKNKTLLEKTNALLRDPNLMLIVVEVLISFKESKEESSERFELLEKVLKGFDVDENGPSPLDKCHSTPYSPLMLCSIQRNSKAAKILLNFGASINYVNRKGSSALSLAVYYGDYDMTELLLDNGADPLLRDTGCSILHLAAGGGQENNVQILALLLERIRKHFETDQAGIVQELNFKDEDGDTPLMYAVAAAAVGNADLVRELLKHQEVNINAENNDGKTALDWAMEKCYEEIAPLLVFENIKRTRL